MELEVVVEIPRGSRNKYEIDRDSGKIRLDRTLTSATYYPADYGFIPGTAAEDGDALDCLVLVPEPTFPGCVITVRPLGVFWMRDEKGQDSKVLAVPVGDELQSWTEIEEVPRQLLLAISHFFEIYKDLEPGKSSDVHGWDGRQQAEQEIEQARARYRSSRPD